MCYRCRVCTKVVHHRRPRLLHTIYRKDGSIQTELPVCQYCKEAFTQQSFPQVLRKRMPGYSRWAAKEQRT